MNSARFRLEAQKFCEKHSEWSQSNHFTEIKRLKSFPGFEAEFTILLHPLYEVPVLYFLVMKLEVDENDFSSSRLARLEEIPFLKDISEQTISFGECPSTGQVMYFLHPCQTAEFMSSVMKACPDASYLESWYSFVNQVIKIES